jgi:hypothetical protein
MIKSSKFEQSNYLIQLATNRVDHSFPSEQDAQLIYFTPGEEISTQPDFLRYFN